MSIASTPKSGVVTSSAGGYLPEESDKGSANASEDDPYRLTEQRLSMLNSSK